MPRAPSVLPSAIGNKIKRSMVFSAQRAEKAAVKREKRQVAKRSAAELGSAAPPKSIPRTIENTRLTDDATIEVGDVEVAEDEASDEFARYFAGALDPKVLVTTSPRPSRRAYPLIGELIRAVPNAFF
jgi:ribosome production factor 1